ncbi:MAG: hypothetical protein ABXS93_08825 [Sulfurimonas sp.]
MLGKILESLYVKVFINIILHKSGTTIYVEHHSKAKEISSFEESFNSNHFTEEIYQFIIDQIKESPYYYISFLDPSLEQGALPTCDKNKLAFYQDLSTSEYKCIDKSWSIYTSKTDLYALEKKYSDIGIDFVFSPYSVLTSFFHDKIDKNLAMFVLVEEGSLSVAIFENSELLFAEYLDMGADLESEKMVLEEDDDKDLELDLDDEGIILDDLDVDDALDDFSDIEDLDSLEDIDEFSEGKDLEEELKENELQEQMESEEHSQESEEGHFNEDYQRFSLLQNSINHFYKDPKYEGKFIENIYIADGVQVNSDLKRYLEEEMFLNVYIRSTDLASEVCELAKKELGV